MMLANSRLFTRCAAVFLVILMLTGSCPVAFARNAVIKPVVVDGGEDSDKPLIDFSLKASTPDAEDLDNSPAVAAGQALPQERVSELIKGLPSLTPAREGALVIPENSLVKPPLPGVQIAEPFPPKSDKEPRPPAEKVEAFVAPLKVERVSPTGQTEDAREISITFSQPMTALKEVGSVDIDKYLHLSPQPAGQWEWAGTQTLLFHPNNADKRLPKATDYAITVPTTIKSINGKSLEQPYSAVIETPPLAVLSSYPFAGVPQSERPIMLLTFNQRIDRSQVLSHLQLSKGSARYALELVPDNDPALSADYKPYLTNAKRDANVIVVRPVESLPLDAVYQLYVMPGCPSAEGPKLTKERRDLPFTVHGPLKLTNHPPDGMPAGYTSASFSFNNSLKTKGESLQNLIQISPPVKQMKITGVNGWLSVQGQFRPFEKYAVTISGKLQDQFGQRLGKDLKLNWTTGSKPKMLSLEQTFLTIAPDQKPVVSFFAQAVNLAHVKIYRVKPSDLSAFSQANWSNYDYQKNLDLGDIAIGELVHEQDYPVGADGIYTDVDLSSYLHNKHGQFVVVASCPSGDRNRMLRFGTWVQVTELGLDVFRTKDFNVLVTRLADGKAVHGAIVQCGGKPDGTTDKNGIASFAYGGINGTNVSASLGDDVASMPPNSYNVNEQLVPATVVWHCVSDRGLYKPGQKVCVKGWQRGFTSTEGGAVKLFDAGMTSVKYEVLDCFNQAIAKGSAPVDRVGAFDFKFDIPDQINLGTLNIHIFADDSQLADFASNAKTRDVVGRVQDTKKYETFFNVAVQDYRRPEFEMKTTASSHSAFIGDTTKLTAHASYFGGGALAATKVKWTIRANSFQFTPPNWPGFSFAKDYYRAARQTGVTKSLDVVSDANGVSTVETRVDKVGEPMSVSLYCEATFNDINRQTWSSTESVTVHTSRAFIGTRAKADSKGENVTGSIIVTDDGGKPISGRPVKVALQAPDSDNQLTDVLTAELLSSDKPVDFSFALPGGNSFTLKATTTDSDGHPNIAQHQLYVPHLGNDRSLAQNHAKDLTISPDKDKYSAGDTAKITIKSPVYPAEGLLFVSRILPYKTIPIKLTEESTTVDLAISEDDYPNLQLQAFVNGKNSLHATALLSVEVPPTNKTLKLRVTPDKSELAPGSNTALTIDLKDAAGAPVAGGHVACVVVDESLLALGNYKWSDPISQFYPHNSFSPFPVFSRDSIYFPMDESTTPDSPGFSGGRRVTQGRGRVLYGSTNGASRDINTFAVEPNVLDERHFTAGRLERHQVMSAALPGMLGAQVMPMARMAFKSSGDAYSAQAAAPVQLQAMQPFLSRVNFSELALFAPDVVTDSLGQARVSFKLPDSTTKYRIMAIAVKDLDKFGAADGSLSTKLPLSIKPSLPRFLNFGDKCELPFIVQNQTDKAITADVVVRTQNGVSIVSSGKKVDVPANGRVEVRFLAEATARGTMSVQSAVVADNLSDAATMSIPVMVPATFETFAAYGQVDKGSVIQKLEFPKDVYDELGGLKISTSSTALQSLTDAYMYMVEYPFDCSEQVSARILSMLSLHDALVAFKIINGDQDQVYKTTIQDGLKKLLDRQLPGGGFGLWSATEQDNQPYMSLQVIKALSLASSKAFVLDAQKLAESKSYLKEIKNHIPPDYSDICKRAIRARALSIRHDFGDNDVAEAKNLVAESHALFAAENAQNSSSALEMACWLLPILARATDAKDEVQLLRRVINNAIVETASTASANIKGWEPWFYLLYFSPRRVDAEILGALMEDQPDSELIPKLVKGLLGHRTKGAWNGTQENYVILEALDKYFHRYEKDDPNFIVREWVGDAFVGQQSFVGRTTETKALDIPTKYLLGHAAGDVLFSKDGPGRLYYRLGMDYVPRNLVLKPLSLGFDVSKDYEGVEKKADASRDTDGIWHFKAGALVKCKVHFSNIGARYHVALMAPMPAGCEPVNGALAGNQTILPDEEPSPPTIIRFGRRFAPAAVPVHSHMIWWWRDWYEHQNLRDHQAEAFASLLNAGEHNYSYTMRATTPGRFVVPPTKIEEMYDSETFGRTGTETVIVE